MHSGASYVVVAKALAFFAEIHAARQSIRFALDEIDTADVANAPVENVQVPSLPKNVGPLTKWDEALEIRDGCGFPKVGTRSLPVAGSPARHHWICLILNARGHWLLILEQTDPRACHCRGFSAGHVNAPDGPVLIAQVDHRWSIGCVHVIRILDEREVGWIEVGCRERPIDVELVIFQLTRMACDVLPGFIGRVKASQLCHLDPAPMAIRMVRLLR